MTLQFQFVRRVRETEDVSSFYFEPSPEFAFAACQYVLLTLPHTDVDDRDIERAFTIASSPADRLVRITTRLSRESSRFKRALLRLARGATSGNRRQITLLYSNATPDFAFRRVLTELNTRWPEFQVVYTLRAPGRAGKARPAASTRSSSGAMCPPQNPRCSTFVAPRRWWRPCNGICRSSGLMGADSCPKGSRVRDSRAFDGKLVGV